MKVESLTWDSVFFNLKVGKLTLAKGSSLAEVEHLLTATEEDVVYVILPASLNSRFAETLEALGARLVDQKRTYHKDLKGSLALENDEINLEEAKGFSEKLESLAWQSGVYSRFYLDEKFEPKFREMYTTWLKKSLSGEMADKVIVARDSSAGILGFVTLKKDGVTGIIGLVAVDEATRGKGVGRLLINEADKVYLTWGVEKAKVITQGANLAACGLYEKMGYSLEEEQYIYHYWKK